MLLLKHIPNNLKKKTMFSLGDIIKILSDQ